MWYTGRSLGYFLRYTVTFQGCCWGWFECDNTEVIVLGGCGTLEAWFSPAQLSQSSQSKETLSILSITLPSSHGSQIENKSKKIIKIQEKSLIISNIFFS